MKIKIGINGLGRIGRMVIRSIIEGKLNNFEINNIGVVIKPPKPNKINFLLNRNNVDTFKNIFNINENLFLELTVSLFILSFLILSK